MAKRGAGTAGRRILQLSKQCTAEAFIVGDPEPIGDVSGLAERLAIDEDEAQRLLDKAPQAWSLCAALRDPYDYGGWIAVDPESGDGLVVVEEYGSMDGGPVSVDEVVGILTMADAKKSIARALLRVATAGPALDDDELSAEDCEVSETIGFPGS